MLSRDVLRGIFFKTLDDKRHKQRNLADREQFKNDLRMGIFKRDYGKIVKRVKSYSLTIFRGTFDFLKIKQTTKECVILQIELCKLVFETRHRILAEK